MNWLDRILMRFVPFIVIDSEENGPYMVRYKLFRCPWFKIFLHHILRSDEDEELHDHPWNFVSLILWSGYHEILPTKGHPSVPDWPRRIRTGAVVRHRAADAHRLILERPAWTLVAVTGKKRHWGFWTKDGWLPYEEFFDRKYGAGNWVSF
jgi:hypothetical protein